MSLLLEDKLQSISCGSQVRKQCDLEAITCERICSAIGSPNSRGHIITRVDYGEVIHARIDTTTR